MMGLKDGVFHLSWFITYVLQVKFCHSLLCYIFCDGVGRNTLMLVSLYCIVGMEQYAIFPMIWCLWLERNDRIFNDVLTLVDLHSKGPISCIPPMSSLFSFFYLLVTRVGEVLSFAKIKCSFSWYFFFSFLLFLEAALSSFPIILSFSYIFFHLCKTKSEHE